jgi:PIN domain nuclease of toxin-antitoxin system
MDFLLDTCTFLWILSNDGRLTDKVRSVFSQPENSIYLSAASSWEIAVKYSMGKLPLPQNPIGYIPAKRKEHKIDDLPISEEVTFYLTKLPAIHKDPFDRILVCQSIVWGYPVLTPDPLIHQYPVKTVWA